MTPSSTTTSPHRRPAAAKAPSVAAPVDPLVAAALGRARDHLLSLQKPDGHWCGELQGDSILESEYILMKFILGQENDPQLPLVANHLRRLQDAGGGWSMFPGGSPDVSGTVKAYYALKLMGDDPASPHMVAAREVSLRLGGVQACNSFTKFFFAALGQIGYDDCPAIPPEIVFLPRWFYFNLYNVSAWTRTMILPLGLVTTLRPVRLLPQELSLAELILPPDPADTGARPDGPHSLMFPRGKRHTAWGRFFLLIDRLLKLYNQAPIVPLRELAIRRAEKWLIDHLKGSEGLGAIFPPMVYLLIVFRILGYPDDHPLVVDAQKHLRDFIIQEGDAIRLQPCLSPVWDTGIALHALAEAGLTADTYPAAAATRWLLGKECRVASDWSLNRPGVEPSGWYFEYANPHYPDVDDTAMAVMSLRRIGGEAAEPAIRRGIEWLLAMQNDDGGWAAFDRTKDRPILEHIPFADHNAMQDPSCPDITGRVLEGLGHNGFSVGHPAVARAVAFIRSRQEPEGCWFGRWGVNYIYGTWQVLAGLRAVGHPVDAPFVRRADAWLRSCQKPDGSWGEGCETYEDPSLKGRGQSTPSQTAWGMMGLTAASKDPADDPAVRRAARWLADRQRPDGDWDEEPFTGTGFPKVFYLRYHLYRLYFPVMALGRYTRMAAGRGEAGMTRSSGR